MTRGAKTTKKTAAESEPKKAKGVDNPAPLPDLAKFFVDLYDWPTVVDILAAESFKEALDKFSDVANFRTQLKEALTPCYIRKRIPRTPKNLAHKEPPRPFPKVVRPINFELDFEPDDVDEIVINNAVIVVTEKVPQTPNAKLKEQISDFKMNKKSPRNARYQSPFNQLCTINPVIAATPSPGRIISEGSGTNISFKARMMQSGGGFQSPLYLNGRATMPTSASRPILNPQSCQMEKNVPDQSSPKDVHDSEKLKGLQDKLDEAGKRHEDYLREQKERVARDNEQRKRRVDQNLRAKEQELEKKREEQRLQQEKVRQFGEVQRLPKTPLKVVTPANFQTPGQKIVPPKRAKPVQTHVVTPKTVSKPIPTVKPTTVVKSTAFKSVTASKSAVVKPAFVVKPAYVPILKFRPAFISKGNNPQQPTSTEVILEKPAEEEGKDNKETPAIKQKARANQNTYEMTPDKIFQPSTENDYNLNDLSSADETDNEDNPRKKVPEWAEKEKLRANIENLFRYVRTDTITAHFGTIKTPKMTTLFANNGKSYDESANETTRWDSPVAKPKFTTSKANPRDFKK